MALVGCSTTPDGADPSGRSFFARTVGSIENAGPVRARGARGTTRVGGGRGSRTGRRGFVSEGSGQFVSGRAPRVALRPTDDGERFALALNGAPLSAAADSVLGEALSVSYAVDPRLADAPVSLQTAGPVSKDVLLSTFEASLAMVDGAIVERDGTYSIVPRSEALGATPAISIPRVTSAGPGTKIVVHELRSIAASEMRTILEPIVRSDAIVRVDEARNYLMVAGNDAELRSISDAIEVFDVDALRGQSVGLFPLSSSAPEEVAEELEAMFATSDPNGTLIQFLPNRRMNAILVVTARQNLLRRAERLIADLDQVAGTAETQLHVYPIQNRPAKELAEVLRAVLAEGGGSAAPIGDGVAPDLTPVSLTDDGGVPIVSAPLIGATGSGASVVADEENNALLISTTSREFERIERILHRLDQLPVQVMIEAVIAEVALNDELKFGLRFAVEDGGLRLGLSDLVSGFAGAAFPGFSAGFNVSNLQVTLNALASITDVNVVSAPTLMALNNQTATLQVGDQVPIVTQQARSAEGGNAPVVNSVELKDTGIILEVTPRLNSSGRVLLDISQEVSNVVRTTTSGIDSPTIQQRRISTRVVVADGEALALGGLIQERNQLTRGQVPVLGDIPVIGNAFKNKTDSINKTELLIFIRPRVVRDVHEARSVTEEFRQRLDLSSAIDRRRGGTRTEQNLKRIAY